MFCDERFGLISEYVERADALFVAVIRYRAATHPGERDLVRATIEEARARCEQAKLALQRHTAVHRCVRPQSISDRQRRVARMGSALQAKASTGEHAPGSRGNTF